MDTFRHRTHAKHALGGLLKPLFRQFQGEVRRIVSGLCALGFVAPLDASNVVPHPLGSLGAVAHPKQLIGGTQMLLYG
jgi:hypothetical protein